MEYGIKNVFRFYDDVSKQNRYLDYVHGNLRTWKISTSQEHFPSFQIKIASGVTQASDVTIYLVDLSDSSETDISSRFTTTGGDPNLYVQVFTDPDYSNYLIYNKNQNLSTLTDQGVYYLKVNDGTSNFYSEVFCVNSTNGKLIVQFYDSQDLADIDYTNGARTQFTNQLIVDTALQRPEWVVDEEGVEDGNTDFLPTFQKLTKRHKFIFYAPEYIIDSVMLIELHDNITVNTNYNEDSNEVLTVYDFKTSSEWLDTKGFAKVTCEFRTDPVLKTNCQTEIT